MPVKQGKTLALCVFIDAFGWEILSRHPFLDDVLVTKRPLETVFGYSSTCDPTILSGKMPRDHGHFSFFYYNPAASPFGLCRLLSVLPRTVTRRGRVRRVMSRVIKRLYGFTGYFQIYNMPFRYLPLFDYSERRDLYERGGMNSGVPTLFDHLRYRNVPYSLSDWRAGEESNLARLTRDVQAGEVRFAYLYMAAMDAVLHAHGTDAPEVSEKIAWYEARLREVLAAAEGRYETVRLFIFSDHGMTDIHTVCDLMPRVERLGLRFGVDYAAVYDSTMARFWFLREGARERITAALAEEVHGAWMTEEQLARYGCDFPTNQYGDAIFLLKPGVLLCPSFMGETPLAGMHGYTPEDKDSTASFMSNVELETPPRRLDDLYGLMYREAGLP